MSELSLATERSPNIDGHYRPRRGTPLRAFLEKATEKGSLSGGDPLGCFIKTSLRYVKRSPKLGSCESLGAYMLQIYIRRTRETATQTKNKRVFLISFIHFRPQSPTECPPSGNKSTSSKVHNRARTVSTKRVVPLLPPGGYRCASKRLPGSGKFHAQVEYAHFLVRYVVLLRCTASESTNARSEPAEQRMQSRRDRTGALTFPRNTMKTADPTLLLAQ